MKLRMDWCQHCNACRTFRQVEVIRFGKAIPFLECRTCARKKRDRKRKPFIKLRQLELFS